MSVWVETPTVDLTWFNIGPSSFPNSKLWSYNSNSTIILHSLKTDWAVTVFYFSEYKGPVYNAWRGSTFSKSTFLTKNPKILYKGMFWVHPEVLEGIFSLHHLSGIFHHLISCPFACQFLKIVILLAKIIFVDIKLAVNVWTASGCQWYAYNNKYIFPR